MRRELAATLRLTMGMDLLRRIILEMERTHLETMARCISPNVRTVVDIWMGNIKASEAQISAHFNSRNRHISKGALFLSSYFRLMTPSLLHCSIRLSNRLGYRSEICVRNTEVQIVRQNVEGDHGRI